MGIYQWKAGARFSHADANKVAAELEALPERTPEAALVVAEDEASELHKCATWDDSKAAHIYRLQEMRSVIRSVIVVDTAADREPLTYRAFEYVTVTDGDEQKSRYFAPTKEVLSDPDFRKQVLSAIKSDISELSAKAKVYRYLAEEELTTAQHHLEMAHDAVKV